jgi:hypothetical protein
MPFAPVGATVFNAYWAEHYDVLSHNDDGTVTVWWHGDARCSSPRPAREATHRTPLTSRDVVLDLGSGRVVRARNDVERARCTEVVL